jgi:hypothetical protein
MGYKVFIDDNFHYMDERARYLHGEFATAAEAVAAARRIVDEYLVSALKPGMGADELFASYAMFGEDPFIVAPGEECVSFSARDHARDRCLELVGRARGTWRPFGAMWAALRRHLAPGRRREQG